MTNTETPTELTATIDTYIASLDEADDAKRAELVARSWAEDGRYTDPLQEHHGHAELASIQVAVQHTYPGASFRRTSGLDVHHESVRFSWELANPDGSLVVAGIDVGTVGADGRLTSIVGFFGDLPEA